MLLPLSIIIFISSIKEIIEDLRKHKFDTEENTKLTRVLRNGEFPNSKWQYLRVGSIIRVNEDQYLPADMLVLHRGLTDLETTLDPQGISLSIEGTT